MLGRITEQAILNGFRNVILMGDHAGGQPQVYEEVAKKLDGSGPNGARVFYCDQVYRAANDAFDRYLAQHGYPLSLHGGIPDTSEMMYLDKDNTWVRRDLVSSAVGDPVVNGKAQFGPQSPQNGILGDARRSTAELGKRAFDMKVDFEAATQVTQLILAAHRQPPGEIAARNLASRTSQIIDSSGDIAAEADAHPHSRCVQKEDHDSKHGPNHDPVRQLSAQANHIGARLGPYEILQPLGAGSIGVPCLTIVWSSTICLQPAGSWRYHAPPLSTGSRGRSQFM